MLTKDVEQQASLSWHRMRQGFIEERTALINRLRGRGIDAKDASLLKGDEMGC